MNGSIAHITALQRFAAALAGIAMAVVFAFALQASTAAPAYAADVDPQTQEALQELEQAFTEAYEAAQGTDVAADEASSLSAEATVSGEAIDDEETPLAAYSGKDASAEADTAAAAEEEILDEENPLAASPYAAPVYDFVWVLLAAIVAVAGFFFVYNRRLDKNIDQMRRFVD